MCDDKELCKEPWTLAVQHYEFVSKEFTDYFKMYMQSWSIVGSVLFVGIIFGLKDVASINNLTSLQSNLLCLAPILLLVWFLPTCWFWGYFIMYRRYLCCLEKKISNLPGAPMNIVCFHSYRHSWFEGAEQTWASIIAIGLLSLIYLGLAGSVSAHVEKLWIFNRWLIFLCYVVIGVMSFAAATILLKRIPKPKSSYKSNSEINKL